jgi:hypothetical protein
MNAHTATYVQLWIEELMKMIGGGEKVSCFSLVRRHIIHSYCKALFMYNSQAEAEREREIELGFAPVIKVRN